VKIVQLVVCSAINKAAKRSKQNWRRLSERPAFRKKQKSNKKYKYTHTSKHPQGW